MNPSKLIDKMRAKNGGSLHAPASGTVPEKWPARSIAKVASPETPAKPKKEKIPHKPKALDKFVQKKGRLPDGSIVVATWDATRVMWNVTLTVMDAVKPTHLGEASGLFRAIVAADNAYRDHLKAIAAPVAPEAQ